MNIKIIRCNNVYGPRQYPEKLIPKFKRLLKDGKKCTIHGSKSATIKRAFMHVEDVVDAVDVIWKRGTTGEIYNIENFYKDGVPYTAVSILPVTVDIDNNVIFRIFQFDSCIIVIEYGIIFYSSMNNI